MELKDLILLGIEIEIREAEGLSEDYIFKKKLYSKEIKVKVRITPFHVHRFKTNQELEAFICQEAIEKFKAQGYSILGGTDGKEAAVENQR